MAFRSGAKVEEKSSNNGGDHDGLGAVEAAVKSGDENAMMASIGSALGSLNK